MLSAKDLVNIFLPVISHYIIWLIFILIVIIILILYAYTFVRKPKFLFSSLQIYKFYREKFFDFKKHKKDDINYHKKIPIAAIISLYIFTKMLEGVIYQGPILKVDTWVYENVLSLGSTWIYNIALFITNFGGTIMITILFIIALAVLIFKKRWRFAILSTIAILGALLLQIVIKDLVHRTRPVNLLETGFSFPSGHAMMAIIFVSLLIYSFKDDFKNKIVKYVLIIVSSAFFIAVGISRIIIHVHWFSDVIAGMSISLFWFMCVLLVQRTIPSAVPAIKKETKEAKPIVPKEVTKAVAKVPKKVVNVPKKVTRSVAKIK